MARLKRTLKPRRPVTERAYLDRLPQFQADESSEFVEFDPATGELHYLPVPIEAQIESLLSEFMGPYVREASFLGKPTNLRRFFANVKRAIAVYMYQRDAEPSFDRQGARIVLTGASDAALEAVMALEKIEEWWELSTFVWKIFHDESRRGAARAGAQKKSARQRMAQVARQYKEIDEAYSKFAPFQLIQLLRRLESVLSLAAERVKLDSSAQRDETARLFTEGLAVAWACATGALPKATRPGTRTRNVSPFLRLLSIINCDVLDERYRSNNDFREYGISAAQRAKRKLLEAS
jgi:hypothetical protein